MSVVTTAVCEHCGQSFSYTRAYGPPRRYCSGACRRLKHVDEHRQSCVDCGKPVRQDGGRSDRCSACVNGQRGSRSAERDTRIRELWANPTLSAADIGEQLGLAKTTVTSLVSRMRGNGYDLPHRPSGRTPGPATSPVTKRRPRPTAAPARTASTVGADREALTRAVRLVSTAQGVPGTCAALQHLSEVALSWADALHHSKEGRTR